MVANLVRKAAAGVAATQHGDTTVRMCCVTLSVSLTLPQSYQEAGRGSDGTAQLWQHLHIFLRQTLQCNLWPIRGWFAAVNILGEGASRGARYGQHLLQPWQTLDKDLCHSKVLSLQQPC